MIMIIIIISLISVDPKASLIITPTIVFFPSLGLLFMHFPDKHSSAVWLPAGSDLIETGATHLNLWEESTSALLLIKVIMNIQALPIFTGSPEFFLDKVKSFERYKKGDKIDK